MGLDRTREDVQRLVDLMLESERPAYRVKQMQVVKEAASIVAMPNFRKSKRNLERLIELKWRIPSLRKKGRLEVDMQKLEIYMALNDINAFFKVIQNHWVLFCLGKPCCLPGLLMFIAFKKTWFLRFCFMV